MRPPTLKDVAKKAGVGVVTASTVLNGTATGTRVSEGTRQRILDVAAELQYHPNAMARGLRRRRAQTIGVLYDTSAPFAIQHNAYASGILEGVLTTGREAGYHVLIFTSVWEGTGKSAAPFRDQQTDGILVIAPRRGRDIVSGLASLGIALVVASAPVQVPGVPSVDVDNAAGARLVADHLAQLGHRRIAYLSGNDDQFCVGERRDAFWSQLERQGIMERPEYRLPGTFALAEARNRACHLLTLPEPPTALFATNDSLAIAALQAARELGIRVPEELSLVGFDNIPLSAHVDPPLTTIHHPIREVGKKAMELLIQKLSGENTQPELLEPGLLEPELLIRATTAPPRI